MYFWCHVQRQQLSPSTESDTSHLQSETLITAVSEHHWSPTERSSTRPLSVIVELHGILLPFEDSTVKTPFNSSCLCGGLCFCVCIVSCLSSFPSVSPCVCVCVAGGVAGSWAAADQTHLRSIHSNHPLLKSLVVAPRRRWIIASSCYRHVLPYSALHPRHVQDLPASTLPFQPVSTSPAHPAVPAGIYLSCFNKLC